MISKDKIKKVMIYNAAGKQLISTESVYFPKDYFKIRGSELVMLKGSGYPIISKEENIDVIFEYINGDRMKYQTHIDLCTEYQVNFHISDGEMLQERRRSFKVTVDFNGMSPFYIRGEEMYSFDAPVELRFININLGGVLFSSNSTFEPGDQVMLHFLDDEMQLLAEILRVQRNEDGELVGYGCRFINVSKAQEEKLARFIFDCQVAERDRRSSKKRR